MEPLACVWRGQNQIGVAAGDVVLVMGAGPIGVLHVMLARLRGATRSSSPNRPPGGANRPWLWEQVAVDPLHEELAAVVAAESRGGAGPM